MTTPVSPSGRMERKLPTSELLRTMKMMLTGKSRAAPLLITDSESTASYREYFASQFTNTLPSILNELHPMAAPFEFYTVNMDIVE